MNEIVIIGLVVCLIGFLIWHLGTFSGRIKKKIIGDLKEQKFELLEILEPEKDHGPFPKLLKIESDTESRILGFSGERIVIRRVKFHDKNQEENYAWVKIETTMFKVDYSVWNPRLKDFNV